VNENEKRLYEAFGLPVPQESPDDANNGAGDPPPTEGAEGAGNGAGDPPSGEGVEGVGDGKEAPSPTGEGKGSEGESGSAPPTPQKETEAQKVQELENRIREEMKQSHDAQLREIFSAMGLKDQNGNPITTMDAYRELQQREETARLERDLKAGKLTPEGLQSALANLPGVKETVEAAQRVQQEASQKSFIAQREVQLAEIRKINPSIRSLNDIVSMDTGRAFIEGVNNGLDYVSAYKLANYDSAMSRARAAGEQAARNAAASKSHLQQTHHSAKGGVEVTQGMRERYRRLNPNITDEQIASVEARFKKG
jgi:hypothetical protein